MSKTNTNPGPEGGFVSLREAARLLGLSYSRAYVLVRRGTSGDDPSGLRADWFHTGVSESETGFYAVPLAEVARLREYRGAMSPLIGLRRTTVPRPAHGARPSASQPAGGAR